MKMKGTLPYQPTKHTSLKISLVKILVQVSFEISSATNSGPGMEDDEGKREETFCSSFGLRQHFLEATPIWKFFHATFWPVELHLEVRSSD